VVEAPDERVTALEALTTKYPQYASEPPSGAVVAIDVERISGWEASAAIAEGER
jgi:hypothetical protein